MNDSQIVDDQTPPIPRSILCTCTSRVRKRDLLEDSHEEGGKVDHENYMPPFD